MAASLQGTKTMENLMRAFAGESQARNRYTFAAACAKRNSSTSSSRCSSSPANQEKNTPRCFTTF